MRWNLNLLFLYFAFSLSLVATGFCWVSSLAYPNLLGTKVFVVVCSVMHKSNPMYGKYWNV
jgi:hypothetical protein